MTAGKKEKVFFAFVRRMIQNIGRCVLPPTLPILKICAILRNVYMEIGCIVNKMKTQSEKIGKLLLLKFKFGQMYILIIINAVITFLLCTLECTDMPLTGFDNNIW